MPINSVMTMSEYIAQPDPEYMPIVKLQEGDYAILDSYTHRKGDPENEEERKVIQIAHYPSASYMQRGKDRQLYAVKKDGDCNSHSCFWI